MTQTTTTTTTTTHTYSVADVETVARRFTADLVMIAQSSGAITEDEARKYGHDVEALAKKGFLKQVDITLLSNSVEQRATQYTVNLTSGDLTMSRPGGVMWPRVVSPYLRIILVYTALYTASEKETMRPKLKISWSPTTDDFTHASLKANGNRDYASNAFGMQRKDYTQ